MLTERMRNITTSVKQAFITRHVKRKKDITFELHSSFKFIKKAVVKRILNVLK